MWNARLAHGTHASIDSKTGVGRRNVVAVRRAAAQAERPHEGIQSSVRNLRNERDGGKSLSASLPCANTRRARGARIRILTVPFAFYAFAIGQRSQFYPADYIVLPIGGDNGVDAIATVTSVKRHRFTLGQVGVLLL